MEPGNEASWCVLWNLSDMHIYFISLNDKTDIEVMACQKHCQGTPDNKCMIFSMEQLQQFIKAVLDTGVSEDSVDHELLLADINAKVPDRDPPKTCYDLIASSELQASAF